MNNPAQTDRTDFSVALAAELAPMDLLRPEDLQGAAQMSRRSGVGLDRTLRGLGLWDDEQMLPVLCRLISVRFVADPWAEGLVPDQDAARRLTHSYLGQKALVPLVCTENEPLPVLMADPADIDLRSELAFHLGREIIALGGSLRHVRALLAQIEVTADRAPTEATQSVRALHADQSDGPIIRFVNEVLAEAVASGASDVHFESAETGMVIRMRINGVLTHQSANASLDPVAVHARLKVMANANVAERRLPQDARLVLAHSGRRIDFRFSSLPTQHGESIALRVLDPGALRLGWDKLGFAPDLKERMISLIERPNGLVLVTGPTGSGKTTTLYTAVTHLNTPRRKIVTVEDPVEYNLMGIQQVQVHEEIGLTFARVLRSVLRHDPNVILVGEIRDRETAEIACRAAQVGRMVLSTLHTRTAEGAPARLTDLGVPRYIVDDVLQGVVAQNLIASDCTACGGSGCRDCGFTGFGPRRLEARLVEM